MEIENKPPTGCALLIVLAICAICAGIGWPILTQGFHTFLGPNRPVHIEVKLPAPNYVTLARQDARDAHINEQDFVNQITVESHFNPNAQGAHGEKGIAQFMPAMAHGLGVDPNDPVASLKAAAQLMGRYVQKYGSYEKALAVYNAGPDALQKAEAQGGDNWKTFLPSSTQQYIASVLR